MGRVGIFIIAHFIVRLVWFVVFLQSMCLFLHWSTLFLEGGGGGGSKVLSLKAILLADIKGD